MRTLNPVTDIRLADGCRRPWEALVSQGPDLRVRRCPHCGVRVYRVTGLTAGQTVALIGANEPLVPEHLYIRRDGTLAAEDRPCRQRRNLLSRLTASLATVICLLAWAVG